MFFLAFFSASRDNLFGGWGVLKGFLFKVNSKHYFFFSWCQVTTLITKFIRSEKGIQVFCFLFIYLFFFTKLQFKKFFIFKVNSECCFFFLVSSDKLNS